MGRRCGRFFIVQTTKARSTRSAPRTEFNTPCQCRLVYDNNLYHMCYPYCVSHHLFQSAGSEFLFKAFALCKLTGAVQNAAYSTALAIMEEGRVFVPLASPCR